MASASLQINVPLNDKVWNKIIAERYEPPTPDDHEPLRLMSRIVKKWPKPPSSKHLQIFICLPSEGGNHALDTGETTDCK